MEVHILIVEDDAIAQLTLIQYLKDLGYDHVVVVDNGDEALKKIASKEVDLVFLDIRIKGTKDGIEIGEIINKTFESIPFFYLTASTDKHTIERACKTKPYSIIHKPYDIKVLEQAMSSVLNYIQSTKVSSSLSSSHVLDMIVETANIGICVTDIHGKFVKVNQAYCEIYGYTRQELIGQDFTLVLPENTKKYAANLHFEFIQGLTEESSGEWKVIDKQGNEKEIYLTAGRMITETGERYKITTITDITERKQNLEKLKKALHEKDTFAREFHHRVKNNFNIISGLLFLQSEKVREKPDIYTLFQESINRIKTMSVIHEQLYNQESFSKIDLREYVTALSNNLQSACIASEESVTIHLHIDDVVLDVDKAIACGLIINEALSNSLKYAFEADQAGEIKLNISNHDQRVNIKISDNGKGLPSNFDLENSRTLGMQLIKILSNQLNGKLSVNTEQGTVINLTFDI